MNQLFSQGTADLLLDACTDFWDGYDLVPLAETDRYMHSHGGGKVLWH